MPPNGDSFTIYGWAVCLWGLLTAFQYGYHISVLNQIQAVLTCKAASPPQCFPISDAAFSFVTAIFTVGGLAGSLVANKFMDRYGRRGSHRICAFLMALGNLAMGLASSLYILLFGRFLIGFASGVGLCVGPIFLAEIAPTKISGNVGVLTQLGIVLGIMLTQVAGINLATPTLWPWVFAISFVLAAAQFFSATLIVESPAWLWKNKRPEDHLKASRRLWGASVPSTAPASEESFLLPPEHSDSAVEHNVAFSQLFSTPSLKKPLLIVSFAMLTQQVSGINAVLYYSNDILAKSLPELGPYISIAITVINVIMTFPPIFLIERTGRKSLLLTSTIGSLVSLAALGLALNKGASTTASLSIVTFVMSFAVGLGPIPFVMIPEVSPVHAVSVLSSVALSLNWIVNFLVGLAFLPLRNLLSGGDQFQEGRVFYLFVGALSLSAVSLFKVYDG